MTLQQLKYAIAVADSKSINKAAQEHFLSQPALSAAIHDLEEESGIILFERSNRGVKLTEDGKDFLTYARQLTEQYDLMEDRFIRKKRKEKFSVSTQHYTFAVKAFMELTRSYDMEQYEFSISETKTAEVIEDVRSFKSEIGVLYLDDFNRAALTKIFKEGNLSYEVLFDCHVYAYLAADHPLAKKRKVKFEDLLRYPCLSFDQGTSASLYFSEEVMSNLNYDRIVKVNDRGTRLNMMVGMKGYTLCSGIICEDLNGDHYRAVRVDTDRLMTIICIYRENAHLSDLGARYIRELKKYKKYVL